MGEWKQARPLNTDAELAAVLDSDLPAEVKLRTVDRLRRGRYARADSPEDRRRRFYVIRGGAVAVLGAGAAWAWQAIRRPSVAVAGGVGGVGALAVPSVLYVPAPAPALPPPPPVVQDMPSYEPPNRTVAVEVEPDGEDVRPVARAEPEPELPEPAPTVTFIEVEPAEKPQQAKPEPEPTLVDVPADVPEPTPTASVDIGREELCLSVGLPPTASLSACLERADKLGLDLGLGL